MVTGVAQSDKMTSRDDRRHGLASSGWPPDAGEVTGTTISRSTRVMTRSG
jgi:hypothetical protein